MKPLRLLLLLLSLAAAAVAVTLLRTAGIDALLPAWLLARAPTLARLLYWPPGDVRAAALAAALVAVVAFGAAVQSPPRAPMPLAWSVRPLAARGPFLLLMVLSAAVALLVVAGRLWLAIDGWAPALLWAAWIALLLALAITLDRTHPARLSPADGASPESSWPWLLASLLVAALLFTWSGAALPSRYPPEAYAAGLQAQEQLVALAAGPFVAGSEGIPAASTLLTSMMVGIGLSPFGAFTAAGAAAGIMLAAAVWLLGCELFRRAPLEEQGDVLRDDGRSAALLAALALLAMLPAQHTARVPWIQEAAVGGVLGLWALLRALRTGRARTMVFSGVMLGLAAIWAPSGWIFAAIAACLAAGMALRRRAWLQVGAGGLGLRGVLAGTAAFAVTASFSVFLWADAAPAGLPANLPQPASLREWLDPALVAFGLAGTTPLAAGALHGVLLLLALGGLLRSIDHPGAWLLLPWLALGAWAAARGATFLAGEFSAWSALALLLPALALAAAFALDAARLAVAANAGAWSSRASATLAAGLLLVAIFGAWASYPHAGGRADTATAAARAVASLPDERPVTLLVDGAELAWTMDALRYALAGSHRATGIMRPDEIATWEFLPQESVLVPPHLGDSLPALRARLPDAQFSVERDILANPALFHVQAP